MKKWLPTILAAVLILGLVGCREQPGAQSTAPNTSTAYSEERSTEQTDLPDATSATLPTNTQLTETAPVPTQTEPAEIHPTETEPVETTPVQTKPVLQGVDNDTLVRVADYIPDIRQALMYATEDNFTGEKIYDFTDAYLRYGTVQKLKKVSAELARHGLGLVIWDGFRPLSAQARLWEVCPDANYVSHPISGNRSHCRGSAVDVTLCDLATGEELEMPSGFDEFTALGDRDYSDCTAEAAENALLLEAIMKKYGFYAYQQEWWHFSDTDSYPVESYFEPSMGRFWYATCNRSMSLRKSPSTEADTICVIYAKDVMELLGWYGDFARVSYNGKTGYVLQNYIKPVNEAYYESVLDTVEYSDVYTYDQMLRDLAEFENMYPGTLTVENIGYSELGRQIPVLRIGQENAKYHVMVQASIHAREHATTWVVMALADYWLDHGILGYGEVCYHIIPMSNPDGVTTVQTGTLTELQQEIYRRDLAMGYTTLSEKDYAREWKANGLGVDINRNFLAGWDNFTGRSEPSSELYGGEAPFSSSEAAALRDYTLRFDFDVTVSYHTVGNIIYYDYGDNPNTNYLSMKLAKAVKEVSGYPLIDSTGIDGAGFKDWTIDELSIPSLTIEVGVLQPVNPDRELHSLFARNYQLLSVIALWLQK